MRAGLRAGAGIFATMMALGCSDKSVPPPGDARTDGRADDRPRMDKRAGDGAAGGICPAQLPEPNGPCTRPGLVCEYGDNPRCLSFAECLQGKWLVAMPKCAPPDPSCPATREAAAGQGCQTQYTYCVYSGLTCDCTNCTKYPIRNCSGPMTWHCESPNTDASCPAARPLLGAPCSKEGQLCEYGCETDVSRRCTGGVWVRASAPGGCPISTRAAKRDIRYLGEAERARVAREATRLRLATYRYRDPAMSSRAHLGFILEDSPASLAADIEKGQVDLYSFTSMVLALAQQQQREIDALRRELASVRRSVGRASRAR